MSQYLDIITIDIDARFYIMFTFGLLITPTVINTLKYSYKIILFVFLSGLVHLHGNTNADY